MVNNNGCGLTTIITSIIFMVAIMALLGGCVNIFQDSILK